MHAVTEAETKDSRESEILQEIREAEKKADEILERAKLERESILRDAHVNSSKLLLQKEEELRKLEEKKLMDFRGKAKLIREEKISDGNAISRQLKSKAEKNILKSVDFVMKKFEEMI